MSRDFPDDNSVLLKTGGTSIISASDPRPCTVGVWHRPKSTDERTAVFCNTNSTGSTLYVDVINSGADNKMQFYSGGYATASNTFDYTNNVWHYLAWTWDDDAGGTIEYWCDGTSRGTTTKTPAGTATAGAAIGGLSESGYPGFEGEARIAEFAMWSVVLTDDEIKALAKGAPVLRIRPGKLASYAPLYGAASPEPDYFLGTNWTLVGSVTQWDHAPCANGFTLGPVYIYAVPAAASWYNTDWGYRKKLTVNSAKVDATLTNFPVLVYLASDSDISAEAQSDGDDILFCDSDGTTKLKHQVQHYNSGTGELWAWVRVPSLPGSTDHELYLYYGNAGAADQSDEANTFSVYHARWDCEDVPTGTVYDSTSNNVDLTPSNMGAEDHVAGTNQRKMYDGGGGGYERIEDTSGGNNMLPGTNDLTVSFWGHTDGDTDDAFIGKLDMYSSYTGWYIYANANGDVAFQAKGNTGNWGRIVGTTNVDNSVDHHVFCVKVGNDRTNWIMYVDGSSESFTEEGNDTAGSITGVTDYGGLMARWNDTSSEMRLDGRIGDARIAFSNLGTSWAITEYNTYIDKGVGATKFLKALGSEETAPAAAAVYTWARPLHHRALIQR